MMREIPRRRWGEVLLSRGAAAAALEVDVLPGVSLRWIMDKIGAGSLFEECGQEYGPEAPWAKPNWTGPE